MAAEGFAAVAQQVAGLKSDLSAEEAEVLNTVGSLAVCLEKFCRWIEAKRTGSAGADQLADAARTEATIAATRSQTGHFETFQAKTKPVLELAAAVKAITDVPALVKAAGGIPVPPFFIETKNPYSSTGAAKPAAPERESSPFAIRVMLTLDGKAWANPQVLQPGSVYDVGLTLTVPRWPTGADLLRIDCVSTLQGDLYRLSPFDFPKPATGAAEASLKGHLQFQNSQSVFSEPVVLQLRARFLDSASGKHIQTADVIGYHKLRARISDPKRTPLLSKYRALNSRVAEIVDELRSLPGLDAEHLNDFIEALGALANYMGICAQQALYRAGAVIKEKQFQANVLQHLRQQLGEDVHEAPKQAGGITDVQFRTVTIELKTENNVSDRAKLAADYEAQPTQYASGVGRQLGLLCILDQTDKESPPAPPQNNLIILKPKLHGFEGKEAPAPTRIVAVIIDGNLRAPSSYSR